MSTHRYSGFAEVISHYLNQLSTIELLQDGVRVTTQCLYPSNGLISVVVRGGNETVIVSDEGGALSEAASAGIQIPFSDQLLVSQIRAQGLKVSKGRIVSPRVPIEASAMAVLLVANASKEIAQWCYDHSKLKRSRDFRKILADFLNARFDDRVSHNAIIAGASNKPHKFANVVNLGDGRRLIVDPVANDPSSINARVVANLDVKAANDRTIEQRIIFDDEDDWSPADLNLLNVGAIAVPFSRSTEVIDRIAASTR